MNASRPLYLSKFTDKEINAKSLCKIPFMRYDREISWADTVISVG